ISKGNNIGSSAAVNGGEFLTLGTSTSPVILTSQWDDTVGGDTIGNLSQPPGPADWGGVQLIRVGAGSQMSYTQLRYGGFGPLLRETDLVDLGQQNISNLEVY